MIPGHLFPVLVAVSVCVGAAEPAAQKVEAQAEGDAVHVLVDGRLFTSYKHEASQKYPYLWPVAGPLSGESVTTESSEPFPHHSSLFFACDRVNGANYWQEGNERGQILSQGPEIEVAEGEEVVIRDVCLWRLPGEEPVIRDHRRIRVTAPRPDLRIIDFDIRLEPLVDVTIIESNHSLFSARMVPELSVEQGGTLVNAEGKTGQQGTLGVPSPWCDYWGTRNDVKEGLAILQHPDNSNFPAPWLTRDYGFFSPTHLQWLDDDRFELKKGEPWELRYRVVIHGGDTAEAGIAELYRDYAGTEEASAGTEGE